MRNLARGMTVGGVLLGLGLAITVILNLLGTIGFAVDRAIHPTPSSTGVISAPPSPATTSISPTPTPSPTATAASSCPTRFRQVAGDNTDTRVDADMASKYTAAVDRLDAGQPLSMAQRSVLLTNAANNAKRLAIWSSAVGLYDNPNDAASLKSDGCLSAKGQQLYYSFKGALDAQGTKFNEANAPANGYNSGVSNGTYGTAAEAGVKGNRKAIHIRFANGTEAYIMVRCGNPVYSSISPQLPAVKTDNNKPTPKALTRKDPSKDPARQGHASTGGGKNADPGPGTYVAPSKAPHPPKKPRQNPAPPSSGSGSSSGGSGSGSGSSGSDPSPSSTPTPEPGAPDPSDAPSSCVPPPGETTC